jgi:hypothetical protein
MFLAGQSLQMAMKHQNERLPAMFGQPPLLTAIRGERKVRRFNPNRDARHSHASLLIAHCA